MNKIRYDLDLMRLMTLFENLTRAKVKDCFDLGQLTFVVEPGQMGLAIGKGGRNLHHVESKLKRPVKVVEYADDVRQFIRNFVHPLRKFTITVDGSTVHIKGEDTKTNGLLIGRERQNVKRLLSVVQRYFPIKEIKVE